MNTFSFAERVEVLEALERNLRSKILNVQQPSIMLDHADKLERDAADLLARASQIRSGLASDIAGLSEIREQLTQCVVELDVIRFCMKRGIKPKFMRRLLKIVINERMME